MVIIAPAAGLAPAFPEAAAYADRTVPADQSVIAGQVIVAGPFGSGDGPVDRDGTGNGGRRRIPFGSRLTAQDGTVIRVAETDDAIGADRDPVHPARPDERAVRAADVLEYPGVLLMPQDRMPPRHPRIGHDDIGLRIPAQPI
jgi:hypothetical protein